MSKQIKKLKRHFKAEITPKVEALQEQYPEAKVEVWAFDEHRLGLKSILRKVWSLLGERVTAPSATSL